MTRGDVVIIADRAGHYTGKPRPAVIVQNNSFPTDRSVTLCPITSERREAPLLRIELSPSAKLPLAKTSWIAVDKITTVRRKCVDKIVGTISARDIARLNASLIVFLGIG